MVKRTQGLPLNTIILAIIAIVVLVFLILIFTGGIGKFVGQTSPFTSSNQTNNALCSEYASAINTQMGTSTDPNAQLQMLANSQYVTSNCSIYFQYSFTLYNGSEVECGLGPNACIMLNSNSGSSSGSGSGGSGGSGGSSSSSNTGSGSSCAPPNGIPGCELK
ncbi:hypothetical protein DDW05_01955 [Candidatus Nanobsidianus stetteri]|uniref:Uncharacterized protein n=1 Tax=Nanobsidianus stetteri TaxID=1294122 RepID=A0A2T9WT93_NANST|nr:hypothetical protein DDW05_01955 [Candidatus Nanobsidianus stetteri]